VLIGALEILWLFFFFEFSEQAQALSFYIEIGTRQKIRRALTLLGTGIGNWKLDFFTLSFYFSQYPIEIRVKVSAYNKAPVDFLTGAFHNWKLEIGDWIFPFELRP
jgi:hypothetical protein